MNGKGFGLVAVLIAIIAAGVYFFVGDLSDVPVKDVVRNTDTSTDVASSTLHDERQDTSEYVRVEHTYTNGTHTLTGEINLPTPCHTLTNSVMIAESFPEQVTVQFLTTTESEMCIQVVTPEPFSVSFKASQQASIRLTLNGESLDYIVTDSTSHEDIMQDMIIDEDTPDVEDVIEEDVVEEIVDEDTVTVE